MFGKVEFGIIYGLCTLMGAGTLYYPSESLAGIIGLLLTILYGFLILVGGVGSLYGVLRPNYQVELVFLFPLAGGMFMYGIGLWAIFAQRIMDGPGGLTPAYAPPLIVCAFGLWLIMKIRYLWAMNRKLIKAADSGLN